MVVEYEFKSQPCTTIYYTYNQTLEGLRCCELPEPVQTHAILCLCVESGQGPSQQGPSHFLSLHLEYRSTLEIQHKAVSPGWNFSMIYLPFVPLLNTLAILPVPFVLSGGVIKKQLFGLIGRLSPRPIFDLQPMSHGVHLHTTFELILFLLISTRSSPRLLLNNKVVLLPFGIVLMKCSQNRLSRHWLHYVSLVNQSEKAYY